MHLFHSGGPIIDPYTPIEMRLCPTRLFSLHDNYAECAYRYLALVRQEIFTVPAYIEAYAPKNATRRARALRMWRRLEEMDSPILRAPNYPRSILLDSGAFTAWTKGGAVSLDSMRKACAKFLQLAGDMFAEILLINLDVIPGQRGRDPTADEVAKAIEESDSNYAKLEAGFGPRILPVYHQGEPTSRLHECLDMVRDGARYVCFSPRNDRPEAERVAFARRAHRHLPHGFRSHGLATTGNKMLRAGWHSADSAAWAFHGANGIVDVCTSRNGVPWYGGFFATERKRLNTRHFRNTIGPTGGHLVPSTVARYGCDLDDVAGIDFRPRALVCMGELNRYAAAIRERRLG